jgi:hypothetical protein
MAKKLYYAALTGNNTNAIKVMRYGSSCTGSFYFLPVIENMNGEERELYLAWTFQALGHTLHLLADASVPSHTRNDPHGIPRREYTC